MTHLRDSKIGKHLDVSIYKFIWQVVVAIIGLIALWYALVGRVDTNERDIGIQVLYGKETRKIAVDHIDYTKGEPLSELEMSNKVNNLEEDVDELIEETDLNTEGRILHDKNMAVQKVQFENIMRKLNELIEK